MSRPVLFVLLALPLFSCAFARTVENTPLEAQAMAQLQPGTSTARDVVETLGAPTEVVQLGKRSAYRYDFTTTKRAVLVLILIDFFNQDSRSDRAWFFFDESDVLTHVGVTLEGEKARYAMPWQDVHE